MSPMGRSRMTPKTSASSDNRALAAKSWIERLQLPVRRVELRRQGAHLLCQAQHEPFMIVGKAAILRADSFEALT